VLPGRAGSHTEGVLAGQATLQPFGEDGFGLVPQGPVSVLGDAGGAIGEVAGCRPRAVRAIGLERQQRGRAGDRVGEDQVGDAGLAGRQQQMQPRIGGGDGAWIEQARRGAGLVGVVGVPGAALGAHHHVAAAAVEPADGPAVGADVQAQLVARVSGGQPGQHDERTWGRHWVTHVQGMRVIPQVTWTRS
jgi:hypothetical protein